MIALHADQIPRYTFRTISEILGDVGALEILGDVGALLTFSALPIQRHAAG
jgi:hypothetical protein